MEVKPIVFTVTTKLTYAPGQLSTISMEVGTDDPGLAFGLKTDPHFLIYSFLNVVAAAVSCTAKRRELAGTYTEEEIERIFWERVVQWRKQYVMLVQK